MVAQDSTTQHAPPARSPSASSRSRIPRPTSARRVRKCSAPTRAAVHKNCRHQQRRDRNPHSRRNRKWHSLQPASQPPVAKEPTAQHSEQLPPEKPRFKLTPTGYVEAYYAYNLNRPRTASRTSRGFDNRHNTFSLSNAALGATWEAERSRGRSCSRSARAEHLLRSASRRCPARGRERDRRRSSGSTSRRPISRTRRPSGAACRSQLGLFASPDRLRGLRGQGQLELVALEPLLRVSVLSHGRRATYAWTDATVDDVQRLQRLEHRRRQQRREERRDSPHLQARQSSSSRRSTSAASSDPTGSPEGPYWRHHFDAIAQVDATTSSRSPRRPTTAGSRTASAPRAGTRARSTRA